MEEEKNNTPQNYITNPHFELRHFSPHFFNYAVLNLYVEKTNPTLVELYKTHVKNHNESILNSSFPNSGFDVFIPNDECFKEIGELNMVNLQIKTEMLYYDASTCSKTYCAYYLEPRSSMSKTSLTLANNHGIIDSGYRGFIHSPLKLGAITKKTIAEFKEKCKSTPMPKVFYFINKHTRLLQITHPSLCPIFVNLLECETQLSQTERGEGGFGSTGVVGSL